LKVVILLALLSLILITALVDSVEQVSEEIYLPVVQVSEIDGTPTFVTPEGTLTSTPSHMPTDTPISTPTFVPSDTPSPTSTLVPSATYTSSPTPTSTASPISTHTPTTTPTPCGYLSGRLLQNVTLVADCKYEVTSPVLVDTGYTLTIPQNVILEFYSDAFLEVRGKLDAQGTQDKLIDFRGYRRAAWRGVSIAADSGASSVIRYARFSEVPDPSGRAIGVALSVSALPTLEAV
jgi:hypothetical protein